MENKPHECRPRTSITGENSDCVDALIRENRQITVRKLSGILNISDGGVKTIIKQHFQYSKVCAWWIPRLLMDKHKSSLLQVAQSLLSRYKQEGDFLWILSWRRTRCGCITSRPRANDLQCSGVTQGLRNPKKWKPCFCWEGYGHHLLGLWRCTVRGFPHRASHNKHRILLGPARGPSKDSPQEPEKKGANISVISPG